MLNSSLLERPLDSVQSPWEDNPCKLWSLYDMLRNYFPIYQIALQLQKWRREAEVFKGSREVPNPEAFRAFLQAIQDVCLNYGLTHTSDLAKRTINRPSPENYSEAFSTITNLDDLLSSELERESIFRIPPERKDYFEHDALFGIKVATAFPSCARDIQKAGSCYALGQEDACVHHLMLVLERGLNALAAKVGIPYTRINWQVIINEIASRVKSLPRGAERDFYDEANAQFGFLKVAYRNHSEHAHDDPYDMAKAQSILTHVQVFMETLEKGGLSE